MFGVFINNLGSNIFLTSCNWLTLSNNDIFRALLFMVNDLRFWDNLIALFKIILLHWLGRVAGVSLLSICPSLSQLVQIIKIGFVNQLFHIEHDDRNLNNYNQLLNLYFILVFWHSKNRFRRSLTVSMHYLFLQFSFIMFFYINNSLRPID